MPHRFSTRSLNNLKHVHPGLVVCASTAILLSRTDFTVYDGLRSMEKQAEYYMNGTSWTMNSNHLPNLEGFATAVDLVPYINGELTWEDYDAFKEIARAMRVAGRWHRIDIRWGANVKYGGDWKIENDMAHFELA